ncbi:MAG: acyltransferase [unclassified Hahellaceae]|nr:acyltransferase [Hahellaceae bacterium]|tara:strand:- start:77060 stop:77950 length:891 start_codon:yes stop_codon:yes gene_type:complete
MPRLIGHIKGAIIFSTIAVNTTLCVIPMSVMGVIKLISPPGKFRIALTKSAMAIARYWVRVNKLLLNSFHDIKWDVRNHASLNPTSYYLVTSNHQSWSDIMVLQTVLAGKAPFLKFFLKKELIWVPVIGIAWWALDFPFMKRYTREQIAKNPELAGKDLETTRKACEHFADTPTAIFNFLEGTRNTPEKHARQQSPYRHLLKPKAGGIAFVIGAMADQLDTLLDISLHYPGDHISFWDLLTGRLDHVVVDIQEIKIPQAFKDKDYQNDAAFKAEFQAWVAQIWEEKDDRLEAMKKG